MDGPRRRARRYFAPVLTDVGLYEVWKTVQRVLTRAASLEGVMDAMFWYGGGTFATETEVPAKSRYLSSVLETVATAITSGRHSTDWRRPIVFSRSHAAGLRT